MNKKPERRKPPGFFNEEELANMRSIHDKSKSTSKKQSKKKGRTKAKGG